MLIILVVAAMESHANKKIKLLEDGSRCENCESQTHAELDPICSVSNGQVNIEANMHLSCFSPVAEHRDPKDAKIVTPNRDLTDSIFRRDGSFHDATVFSKYLHDSDLQRLIAGEDLSKQLEAVKHPYSDKLGRHSPGVFLYVSYLWNNVLDMQFFADVPSLKIRKLRNTFIDEMSPYVNSGLDLGLLRSFCLRLRHTGLRFCQSDNFYEISPILRVLAPSYDTLVSSDSHCRQFYMLACLKGIPHGVIMKAFHLFKLCRIAPLRTSKIVRDTINHDFFLRYFLMLRFLLRIFPVFAVCFARNLDLVEWQALRASFLHNSDNFRMVVCSKSGFGVKT